MKKVMNKRGQLNKWFIPLVVMIIAAGLVIIFFSGGLGFFGDLFERLPNLDIVATTCGAYTEFGVNDYCSTFQKVEIFGVKQYGTCKYFEGIEEIQFEKPGEDFCSSSQENSARKFCQTLKNKEIVNGKPCYVDGEGDDEWGLSKEHPLVIAG